MNEYKKKRNNIEKLPRMVNQKVLYTVNEFRDDDAIGMTNRLRTDPHFNGEV